MPTPKTKRKDLVAKTKKELAAKKKPSYGPTLPMNTPDPGAPRTGDDDQSTAED